MWMLKNKLTGEIVDPRSRQVILFLVPADGMMCFFPSVRLISWMDTRHALSEMAGRSKQRTRLANEPQTAPATTATRNN